MDDDFISEEELLTFEGWMRYQKIDPVACTREEVIEWQDAFDESMRRRCAYPKM